MEMAVALALSQAVHADTMPTYDQIAQHVARAAIAAMREPTEAMLAGYSSKHHDDAKAAWRAMIDEALAEPDDADR